MPPRPTLLTHTDIRALRTADHVTMRSGPERSQIIPWVRGHNANGVATYRGEQQRLFPLQDNRTGLTRSRPIDAGLTIGGHTPDEQSWNLSDYPATTAAYTLEHPHQDWMTAVSDLRPGCRLGLRWHAPHDPLLAKSDLVREEIRLVLRHAASPPRSYLLHVYTGPASGRLIQPRTHLRVHEFTTRSSTGRTGPSA